MTTREKNLAVYQCALKYLHSLLPKGMKEADLDKYYNGDSRDFETLTDVFEQFIQSAQNYQGMPNFIKYSERRIEIKDILLDFDIAQIADFSVEKLCASGANLIWTQRIVCLPTCSVQIALLQQ